jgi:muramidase (phage lysozyme)
MTDYIERCGRPIGFDGDIREYSSSKDPYSPDFGMIEIPKPSRKPRHKSEMNLFDLAKKIKAPKPKEKPKNIPVKKYNVEDKLLDVIGKLESSDNYNIIFGNKEKPLTKMTIKEIYDLQQKMEDEGSVSTAVGRYQFINKTLREIMKKQNIKEDDLFDERVQDQLAKAKMRERGLDSFEKGKISTEEFIKKLSNEWAAIPENSNNKSAHHSKINRSLIDFHKLKSLLEE